MSLGLAPGQQTLVGLYSQNCPEWILTEQACYSYSLVVVPLYDTLGPDACAYIINQADINLVVCEDDQKCNLLLDKAPRYVMTLKSPLSPPPLKDDVFAVDSLLSEMTAMPLIIVNFEILMK